MPKHLAHPLAIGQAAIVRVGLKVDGQGWPVDIRILKSQNEELNQSALEGVGKFRFKPAKQDGHPVALLIV